MEVTEVELVALNTISSKRGQRVYRCTDNVSASVSIKRRSLTRARTERLPKGSDAKDSSEIPCLLRIPRSRK